MRTISTHRLLLVNPLISLESQPTGHRRPCHHKLHHNMNVLHHRYRHKHRPSQPIMKHRPRSQLLRRQSGRQWTKNVLTQHRLESQPIRRWDGLHYRVTDRMQVIS